MNEEKEYYSLDEYFADHPDEEDAFYDALAEEDSFIEYPEDYEVVTCR